MSCRTWHAGPTPPRRPSTAGATPRQSPTVDASLRRPSVTGPSPRPALLFASSPSLPALLCHRPLSHRRRFPRWPTTAGGPFLLASPAGAPSHWPPTTGEPPRRFSAPLPLPIGSLSPAHPSPPAFHRRRPLPPALYRQHPIPVSPPATGAHLPLVSLPTGSVTPVGRATTGPCRQHQPPPHDGVLAILATYRYSTSESAPPWVSPTPCGVAATTFQSSAPQPLDGPRLPPRALSTTSACVPLHATACICAHLPRALLPRWPPPISAPSPPASITDASSPPASTGGILTPRCLYTNLPPHYDGHICAA